MLLKEGYIDLLGSDLHKLGAFQFATHQKVLKKSTVKQMRTIIEKEPF